MKTSHRVPFLMLLLGLLTVGAAPAWAAAGNPLEAATRPIFELNVGQAADEVRFLSRTPQAVMWITGDETVWSYRPSGDTDRPWPTVRMRLVGARPDAPVVGAEPLETYVNDLRGGDPEKWHRRIPTFGRIVREQVYPGIDLQYRTAGGSVEYDFVCAPGADPGQIGFKFSGTRAVGIDDGGNLVLNAGGERFVHEAPVAWQEAPTGRVPVEASFAITDGTVRFQVGEHNSELGLIIDPIVRYSSYLDGSQALPTTGSGRFGPQIAVQADGSAHVGLTTLSTDLPTSTFPSPVSQGSYIAKIAPSGALVWGTYLPESMETVNDLDLDFGGRVYVVGLTAGEGPPPLGDGVACVGGTPDIAWDAYVTRLSSDGTTLDYSTCFWGGPEQFGYVGPTSILVDLFGDAVIGGQTDSPSIPGTAGRFQEDLALYLNAPTTDGFVARFDPRGALRWATYLGGEGSDGISDVALDHSGSILVAGGSYSSDFPTTPGAWQPTVNEAGRFDAFLSVLSGDGRTLWASTLLGGSWHDDGVRIFEGPEDRIYALVRTYATEPGGDFPTTPGAYQGGSPSDETSAAVVAFDFGLTTLEYSTLLHAESKTTPVDLAATPGAVLVLIDASNCPGLLGLGPQAPWVISLDPTLSTRLGCFQYGWGDPVSLEVGIGSEIYLAGFTKEGEIPVVNAFQPDYGGGDNDGFVARLDTYPYLASDGLSFFWNDILGAGAYDLVCGDLGVLRVTGGDFGASELRCLGEDITSPVTVPDPAPGEATWCLVRDVPLRGDGTWDVEADGSRDVFINTSEGACELNPACSHSVCAVAGPLDPECDPCVTQVCAINPGCCDDLWSQECADLVAPECGIVGCQNGSGACEHSMCLTGAPLEPGCDTPPLSVSCVEAICDLDPDCCNPENAWDTTCVDQVWTVCGLECDG